MLRRHLPITGNLTHSSLSALRFATTSGKRPSFAGGAGAGAVPSTKKPAPGTTTSATNESSSTTFDPDRLRARQVWEQEQQREREKQAMLKKQHDDKLHAELAQRQAEERATQEKEDAARKYRETQKQAAEQSVDNIVTRFKTMRKGMTMKQLVLIHGPFFSVWYFMFTSCYTLVIAALLHFKVVPFLESGELAERFGVKEKFDHIGSLTREIGPITLSGRFFANYIVVSAVLAPFIPVKVSAALATYPIALRYAPRWLTQSRAAAADKVAAKSTAAAARRA